MNIAFTLCSINYLAQAKTLYESIRKVNANWHFVIGLVDKNINNLDLSYLECEIVEVEKVNIKGFKEMVESYSIVELITSVKPYYFNFLFNENPKVDKIIYFDPDIMIFDSLKTIENKLDDKDIILTPHFTKPITDNFQPTEKHVFSTGVFNLGFLAVKRSANTINMLNWWEAKLYKECLIDLSRGYFVDQLWMNLVPAYFDNVLIDKYPGYNMAHWNLHERKLTEIDGKYYVNGVPLIFFHFSHYRPSKPNDIATYHTRYNFKTRPDLKNIFENYVKNMYQFRHEELKQMPCYYIKNEGKKKFKKSFKAFFRKNIPLGIKMKLSKVFR